jgi:hypothetical protein
MIATIVPITMPISMQSTVISRVCSTPSRTTSLNRYWPTTPHSKVSVVIRTFRNHSNNSTTTTADAQRHGWRSGTAGTSSICGVDETSVDLGGAGLARFSLDITGEPPGLSGGWADDEDA